MAKTIHLAKRALWRREGAGIVILDEVSGEPYHLDEVGAKVWEELRDGPSLDALVGRLTLEYDGEPERIRDDLEEFLLELLERKLIEVKGA